MMQLLASSHPSNTRASVRELSLRQLYYYDKPLAHSRPTTYSFVRELALRQLYYYDKLAANSRPINIIIVTLAWTTYILIQR